MPAALRDQVLVTTAEADDRVADPGFGPNVSHGDVLVQLAGNPVHSAPVCNPLSSERL